MGGGEGISEEVTCELRLEQEDEASRVRIQSCVAGRRDGTC